MLKAGVCTRHVNRSITKVIHISHQEWSRRRNDVCHLSSIGQRREKRVMFIACGSFAPARTLAFGVAAKLDGSSPNIVIVNPSLFP